MTEAEYTELADWFGAYVRRFTSPSGNLPRPVGLRF